MLFLLKQQNNKNCGFPQMKENLYSDTETALKMLNVVYPITVEAICDGFVSVDMYIDWCQKCGIKMHFFWDSQVSGWILLN